MKRIRLAGAILGMILAVPALAQVQPIGFEGARWIWTAPAPGQVGNMFAQATRYFRFTFSMPDRQQFKSALLQITADNLYTIHLNGRPVGNSSSNPNDWSHPRQFDVMKFLVGGENVLAVEATNTAPGPAGLIVKAIVQLNEGEQITLYSDASWRSAEKAPKGWDQPGFNDKEWRPAHVLGDYGMAPWGTFVGGRGDKSSAPPIVKRTAAVLPVEIESNVPADFPWPQGIVFVSDDCTLYREVQGRAGTAYDSLSVTIFNPRKSRAFPEHDLPAPMKMGRKLCALAPAAPGTTPRVLVDAGKGAVASPTVSFDGKTIYFSAVLGEEKFFHIYRIGVEGGTPQRLTDGPFHDIDPAELPDGRIVFTSTRIGTFEEYHNPPSRALFTMNADGTRIKPISHTIIFDNEPEVMADGRIIYIRSDNFFDRGKVETMLHAVHPDGTEGYTEFGLDIAPEYNNRLRAFHCGSPAPMPDGRVAFVSGPGITIGLPGTADRYWQHLRVEAGDVAAIPDGRLICTIPRKVTYEITQGRNKRTVHDYSYEQIGVIDPAQKAPRCVVLLDSVENPLHSPVFLGPRQRPPVLPPRMNEAMAGNPQATGLLFCQDARFTRNITAGWSHVRAIRVLMGKGLTTRSSHSYIVHAGSEVVELGTVPLAPDGSFAVEVPADTPIAFQAVDAEGRSELNEMSWITVRPGERRGCVGCHQRRSSTPASIAEQTQAMRSAPLKFLAQGQPHRFRGNNAAVTGLMEMQFDRYREVAGLNRHSELAMASATGPQEVEALIAQLKGENDDLKISAANRLAIFRAPQAAAALAGCLEEKCREARVAAAMALSTCGTRESIPPLLEALADKEPLVAQAAAVSLENLTGHARPFNAFAPRPQRRIEAQAWKQWFADNAWEKIEQDLVRVIETGDRDAVRRAAVALGRTGGDPARAALRAWFTRQRDANPLPEWRKNHRGDGARFNSLADVNPRAIQAVTRSLGYLKDQESIPLLASALNKNADPETGNLFLAEACAEALGRIGTPDAEAALISAFASLKDYPQHTSWYGDHGALMACHASPVHYFITEALDAIGSTRTGAIVPHLIKSVPTDPDRALMLFNDDCESLIGRVIRRAGMQEAVVETCLAILGDDKAAETREIEQAIGVVHGAWGGRPDSENRAAQILSLVCRDRKYEPRIRAAFERYQQKPCDVQRVFDRGIPVVQVLPIKHWVCFFLARSLGNLQHPASVDALIAALAQPSESAPGHPDPLGPGVMFLHNDLTPCWRASSAWALGRIGDKRAVPALLKTIADLGNATDTRHAAARALGMIADPASVEPIEKLAAEYPEISTRRAMLESALEISKRTRP